MRTIKVTLTISLLILATAMISPSAFAQRNNMQTFKYYVKVHLNTQQSYTQQYRIEIWDNYGWRVLPGQTSHPGQHLYAFQETTPSGVNNFVRIARFFYIPVYSSLGEVLWPDPKVKQDAKIIMYPGITYFNLYPASQGRYNSSERSVLDQKD